jgi:BMFP domain-containing protein YqiC
MTTTPVYEQILAELAAGELNGLQREILKELRKSYPASVSRYDLVVRIYGYWPEDINKDVKDRKNRKAIQAMRDLLIPIVSSSGEAGYRLDVSEDAIRAMIAEWRSRRGRLNERIEAAEKALIRIHQLDIAAIPSLMPTREENPTQLGLFGRGH